MVMEWVLQTLLTVELQMELLDLGERRRRGRGPESSSRFIDTLALREATHTHTYTHTHTDQLIIKIDTHLNQENSTKK